MTEADKKVFAKALHWAALPSDTALCNAPPHIVDAVVNARLAESMDGRGVLEVNRASALLRALLLKKSALDYETTMRRKRSAEARARRVQEAYKS